MAIPARFLRSLLPALLAIGLVLAACSGDSDDAPAPSKVDGGDDTKPSTGGADPSGGKGGTTGTGGETDEQAGSPAASRGGADDDVPAAMGGAPAADPEPTAGGSGGAPEEAKPSEESPGFARGKSLVEANGCATCHQADFGGFTVFPNISPDELTGIGTWSDSDIAGAIRDGLDEDGTQMCAMMTRFSFDETQMADLIEFLRGIPPVSRKITSVCPGHGS